MIYKVRKSSHKEAGHLFQCEGQNKNNQDIIVFFYDGTIKSIRNNVVHITGLCRRKRTNIQFIFNLVVF